MSDLNFDEIEECFPEGYPFFKDGYGDISTNSVWLHEFAKNIEITIKSKSDWQPIDTAPKDPFVNFLACRIDEHYVFHVRRNFNGGFELAHNISDTPVKIPDLYYWMPLPEPPEESKQ